MRRVRPTMPGLLWAVTGLLAVTSSGCVTPGRPLTTAERAAAVAARPILELDADADWTACFNRLVELGPVSVSYLMRQPVMRRRAAPDDLRVALHTSLLRLLAYPGTAPRLSVNCFETTLDVLHFDPKVRGRRVGTAHIGDGPLPRRWHELYPADFDHTAAGEIDLEADRQALVRWWRARAGQSSMLVTPRRLRPREQYLWRVLSRRYADRWGYLPEDAAILCRGSDDGPGMIRLICRDYNLVRAVCIRLGSSADPAVQERLIEMVGSPSPVVAYNSRFALRYSLDPEIRALLERYEDSEEKEEPAPPAVLPPPSRSLSL